MLNALVWLKNNQQENGSWRGEGSASSLTGMTGIGLLTFLAHGETPSSARFGPTVSKAIRFLVEAQLESGEFRHVERGAGRGGVYAHGIATYALCEAYAMTRNPLLRDPVNRSLRHILNGQRPDGGFDYAYARSGGARDRCTSVAGWQIQAMKAAFLTGEEFTDLRRAMELAADGMRKNQRSDGKFIYASGTGSQHGISNRNIMTAIGTLSLQILGQGRSQPSRRAMSTLSNLSPEDFHNEMEPVYAWYYATQAYFHQGGSQWSQWNRQFAPMAVNHQSADGSWVWDLGRTGDYGPVYHTTLTALSLMVYYRYLPTTQTELLESPVREDTMEDDGDLVEFEL